MEREIYEVNAKVVDANGTFNTLTGYPKVFDSRSYDGDLKKTYQRALGAYHTALGTMSAVDTRKVQIAFVIRMSDGVQVAVERIGELNEAQQEEEPPVEDEPGEE